MLVAGAGLAAGTEPHASAVQTEQTRARLRLEQRRQGEAARREFAPIGPSETQRRAQAHQMQRQESRLPAAPTDAEVVSPEARRDLEAQRLQFRMLERGGVGRPLR